MAHAAGAAQGRDFWLVLRQQPACSAPRRPVLHHRPHALVSDRLCVTLTRMLPALPPCSWCGCNNSALMAELVPEQKRSSIFAFDRGFEVRQNLP